MESDLPLMELVEEDDSLIQPFPYPNQTPSKSPFNYFTCSPLALPPPRTKSLKDSVHTEKPSSSSSESSNNKENINSNNIELPKLGMGPGPIQMKRRKKGPEYNLRKSLAWDRAFFTDEGILDPRELNLITGISAYTCGRGLPSISEEGNSSFSSGRSRCRNEPNHMEASKEALLKELRDCDKSRTPKGNRVGNHDPLPHQKVAHKVLSTDCSNRRGSKVGGCSETSPSPSPSSSLKRPNSITLRTAKKEPKLLKPPVSKSGSCFSATTKGSMTARHNLIPKPPINVQKNVGLKHSLKDVHGGSQGKAKTVLENLQLPAKALAQKTVRILTHSSSKATKSHLVEVDKAKSGLGMVSDRLHQQESASLATESLPQHTPTTSNNSLPSGLRLPSPSLRFFDQTTSESFSLQQKRNQQSKTHSTPCGSSPSSNYIGKTSKRVTDSNIYPDTVRKIILRAEIESHEVIEQEKRICGHKGKMGMEKIALKGDEEIKEHNNLTLIDGSMKFMQDLAQTSKGQVDTENVSEINNDCLTKEKCGSKSSSTRFMEVPGQKQDGVDVGFVHGQPIAEVQLEFRDVAPLIDVSELRHEIELMNGTASMGDNASILETDSESLLLELAECATTYPQSLEEEEGPHIAPTTNLEENQKHQEMGIIIGHMSDPSDVYEFDVKPSNPIVPKTTSTTLCSVIPESCLVVEGAAEGLKTSFREEVEPQVLQEGKNKDATMLMKRSNNVNTQDNSLVMHPPNAFDESLVAIEAPGEDHAQTSKVSFREEVEAEVFQEGKNEDATVSMKRSNTIKRQDKSLVIHAVPFSDEWLAAIEAAGEEILTMKCGAVQHSPPDKSIPERNPWSPVKNKANQIGPYDCTKYTNAMPSNPHLLD